MKEKIYIKNLSLFDEWHYTKNFYLEPEKLTHGSTKKVWWLCEKGHEWQAKINDRSSGNNCPYCSGKRVCVDNCLSTLCPHIAKQWHPTKNRELTALGVVKRSTKKVWWFCEKGHEWQERIYNRTRVNGGGCPYCSGKRVCIDNCLFTLYPHTAEEWHPTKNGKLTPYKVTYGSGKKVWWQCKKGHEWQATISSRVKGNGCPCCSGRKACSDNCLQTTHPYIAKQWHPTKNKKLTTCDIVSNSHKKVWWKCERGHEWQATISSKTRSKRNGCPYCNGKKACLDNCLHTLYPNIAKEWHPTKNGKLSPRDVTPGSNKKVWWKCKEDHEWQSTTNNRISLRRNCPICNESKGEKKIREYFEKTNITYDYQYSFQKSDIKYSKFDFKIQEGLIEYNGIQHYTPISFGLKNRNEIMKNFLLCLKRDEKKIKWCKDNNIPLLIIPYWEKGRISEIINMFLNNEKIIISSPPEVVKKYQNIRDKFTNIIEYEKSSWQKDH